MPTAGRRPRGRRRAHPSARACQRAAASASGCASAGAAARPARRRQSRSFTSLPTNSACSGATPSRSNSSRNASPLVSPNPCWTGRPSFRQRAVTTGFTSVESTNTGIPAFFSIPMPWPSERLQTTASRPSSSTWTRLSVNTPSKSNATRRTCRSAAPRSNDGLRLEPALADGAAAAAGRTTSRPCSSARSAARQFSGVSMSTAVAGATSTGRMWRPVSERSTWTVRRRKTSRWPVCQYVFGSAWRGALKGSSSPAASRAADHGVPSAKGRSQRVRPFPCTAAPPSRTHILNGFCDASTTARTESASG